MSEQIPSIQWFPGHMAKTRRLMKENLKLVDIIVELRDARIPNSSANPEIEKLTGRKPRVILLCKEDLADPVLTKQWIDYFNSQKIPAMWADTRSGKGLNKFRPLVETTLENLLEERKAKGMEGMSIRMMIVGVPNVGKSSLINRLAGSKRTRVEDRPGVTVAKQWIKTEDSMELLDMPGVLWPKFEDQIVGENLALTGAVKDDVVDTELLAMRLLWRLNEKYPHLLEERYKFTAEETQDLDSYGLLELLGRKRGMLVRGGEIDTERAALAALDDFRNGRIGRITLEDPPA